MEEVRCTMGKLFQQQEVLILILGSIISLISTIIGFFAQTFVTSILANKGKVKIYIKSVYNKMTGKPWGFQNSAFQGLMFDVPLWIEIHNMKSTKQVIRNINLVLYNHRKVIGKTVQLSHYEEDVESKVWAIPQMTDFWGIGSRMEKRLNKLGITTIKELANFNPDILKKELGVVGVDLFFHANGIDESNVHKPYKPKSHGLGNSRVLPRDYDKQADIELVLREMAEQVAIRMRRAHKKCCTVSIFVGYSKFEMKRPIQAQMKVEPTNNTRVLTDHVLSLFGKKYESGAVRNIAVSYANFVDESLQLISLFDDIEHIEKEERLQTAIDTIRNQFGFTMIQKANSLQEASRSIARSKLIGGHSAGGLDGLK